MVRERGERRLPLSNHLESQFSAPGWGWGNTWEKKLGSLPGLQAVKASLHVVGKMFFLSQEGVGSRFVTGSVWTQTHPVTQQEAK